MSKTRFVWRQLIFATLLFIWAGHAFAQEPTPTPTPLPTVNEPVAETERVIVTGSHIPTAEEVGPNPVEEITREQIENSGERTPAEIIRLLPQASYAGIPTANNAFGDSGPPGTASVALRGFDASSTLVLIDGRRVAPYPLGAFPTFSVAFTDLNSIPKAPLDSVEVLPDSASAIYGADAVAGVVNIKYRHDFKGAEISTSYGNTLDKDSGEETDSLVFGIGDSLTNVTGAFEFYHRNGLFDRDRGYSQLGPLSSFSSPWNLQLARATVIAAGVPANSLPHKQVFFGQAPKLGDGVASPTAYTYGPPQFNYNVNLDAQAIPDTNRYAGYLSMTRKILGEQLQLYSDVSFTSVESFNVLSPTATGQFNTPGQTILAIPPHSPGPVVAGPTYAETGVPIGAYNPFNPFQQIISGASRARLADFGDRTDDTLTEALFGTIGVRGDKLFGGDWGYDGAARLSQAQGTLDFHGVSASRLNRIMNAADPIFDPTSSQYIGTTIPYNPFGYYRRPIAANQGSVQFATINSEEVDISDLETADFNIYTTSLFQLPAGGVGLAFGGQFRNESIDLQPDNLQIRGDVLSQTQELPITASRESYALYAELTVPIVSSVHPLPGIRSLEVTGAARFEEYLNNNTNVMVPKVGVRWQPFDDSLTIRATWGEGFHEASLLELFAQNAAGTYAPGFGGAIIIDPVTRQPAGEFNFIVHGNPNLQPEDSRAFSGGFVYTPSFHRNLTLTLTLYDVESTGRAFVPGIRDVINRNAAGQALPLEKVTRDAQGNIILVEEAYQNAGSRKARGADMAVAYQLQTSLGTFTSVTQATFLDSLQFAQTSFDQEVELVRNADIVGSNAVPLQWQGNSRFDWNWHGFSVGATAFYLDGFHEHLLDPATGLADRKHYVSQTWLFDVRASYSFHYVRAEGTAALEAPIDGKQVLDQSVDASAAATSCWRRVLDGTTIAIGCNDVFGTDPPHAATQVNYPGGMYDPSGRFVYVRLTKRF